MSVYDYIDRTCGEMTALFWSLVPVVAGQAGITEADAQRLMQRGWLDTVKDIRPYHAIDYAGDGRSALWRVRLMIWRIGQGDQADLHADSDLGAPYNQHETAPGATLLAGLPTVGEWVREMCAQAHPGAELEGLEEATVANKVKSLRVALSNSGGLSVWRLRYTAKMPAQVAPAPSGNALRDAVALKPMSQRYLAAATVQREESPRGK